MQPTIPGPDGRARCGWAAAAPEFLAYHDREWGFPVADDRRLFEKLCLEGFQSGLSWRTILNKRENFRAAFHGFDVDAVARFSERDVARLLADPGIVRHRGKIEAVVNNAMRAKELVAERGSLAAYVWGFEPDRADLVAPQSVSVSPASIALSKDSEEARMEIRRSDNGLRIHAGDGAGQRSCRRLLRAGSRATGARWVHAALIPRAAGRDIGSCRPRGLQGKPGGHWSQGSEKRCGAL